MKTRLCVCLFLTCLLPLAACGKASDTTSSTVTLNVFAGAALTESFQDIATQYHRLHPNVTITENFASGPSLLQQLKSGASADVFALADPIMMKQTQQTGLVGNSQIFAKDTLVVIVSAKSFAHITTLADLSKPGTKIVVENPMVPAGMATQQVLSKMAQSANYGLAYQSNVQKNIVSQEETVKAVAQKVQLGEVDAGFVLQSDVTPSVASHVKVIPIPESLNVVLQFPIAVVKQTHHMTEAQSFVLYVLSPQGQAILAKYHFIHMQD